MAPVRRRVAHVVVAPTSKSPLVCAAPTFFDACVDDSVDGHDVTIAWQDLEPEEDPGVVYVIDRRAGEDVAVELSGRPSPTTRATSTSACP